MPVLIDDLPLPSTSNVMSIRVSFVWRLITALRFCMRIKYSATPAQTKAEFFSPNRPHRCARPRPQSLFRPRLWASSSKPLFRIFRGSICSPSISTIANRRPLRQSMLVMSKRFYLTTAIDYVNGEPHLGHAYEKVITDVIARARRSLGQEAFFLTGLDEHGQKVQQAAQASGKNTQVYCDELAQIWKSFAARLELTNDDFIRTTEPRHKRVVQAILSRLNTAGHFYKA